MIVMRKELWTTLFALTIISILFATSSPLLGAPVPGGPGFLSVGSVDFRSSSVSTTYAFPGNRLVNTSGGFDIFFAPVHLPQGAIITQLVLYFVDKRASDFNVVLWSIPLDDSNNNNTIAFITTSGASPDPRTLVFNTFPNENIIDNQSNFYIVTIGLLSGSDGFNLSDDISCTKYLNLISDRNGEDPLLGPLANNGGPP